jgi:hypothetical protein
VAVANAREIVQLIWALPGDSAFRRNCADVCVRYLGGDPTLINEIWQNRQAQETLAQEQPTHPARVFGEAVENETLKRKREELAVASVDLELEETLARTKKLRVSTIVELHQIAGLEMDDRTRLQLRDMVGTVASQAPREICVREFLLSKGVNPQRHQTTFGKAVAALKRSYLREQGLPEILPTKRITVNGQVIDAKLYYDADMPIFEAAYSARTWE